MTGVNAKMFVNLGSLCDHLFVEVDNLACTELKPLPPNAEEQEFLRAIGDRPDDIAPRLVFSDWLAENGQEDRSEFILLAIELDPFFHNIELIEGVTHQERLKLERYWQLYYRIGCLSEITKARLNYQVDMLKTSFRRGFIEIVACSPHRWEEVADAILCEYPTIREVILERRPAMGVILQYDHRAFIFNNDLSSAKNFYQLLDSQTIHETREACYEEWKGRWPKIRFKFRPRQM